MTKPKAIAKRTITGFSILLFFQHGFAQNTGPIKFHSLELGTSSVSVTDNHIDLDLKGIRSAALGYSYSAVSPYRKKSISVTWNNGQAGKAKLNDFRAAYTDLFSIVQNKNSRFNTYLGYSISTNPVFITLNNEGKRYSWATSTGLSAYSSSAYSWNHNIISLDLSVAVAGFASRPENSRVYDGNLNELLYESYDNLFFTSLHNLEAALIAV
ncbi:MAG: hypothetical protein ACXWWD_09960, partial [Chitinophagaceae bacterium]